MSDKLLLTNYLMVLKSTIEVYVHGTIESSNDDVRKILKNNLDETLKSQEMTYDKMTEYDWYVVNNTSSSNISEILNKIESNNCK